MDEFDIYLISNGSMRIFTENTLSSFTNLLAEPFLLHGNWQIAVSEIITPVAIKNVSNTQISAFTQIEETDRTNDYDRSFHNIERGVYPNVGYILKTLEKISGIPVFSSINKVNNKLSLTFREREDFEFPTKEIPNILGFIGTTISTPTGLEIINVRQTRVIYSDWRLPY